MKTDRAIDRRLRLPWTLRELASGLGTAAIVAGFVIGGSVVLVRDLRAEAVLDARGVTVTGRFLETSCGKGCNRLPVAFTTEQGRRVTADVAVTGEPDDETILLRYDPQHPTTVHPANGVVADEVLSGMLAALGGAVLFTALAEGRGELARARASGRQVLSGAEPVSHVRVLLVDGRADPTAAHTRGW